MTVPGAANAGPFSVLHLGEVGSPYDKALRQFAKAGPEIVANRAPPQATESGMLRAIVDGGQFGALLTTGAVAEIVPSFHIGDLPYVFASPEHARRFWHGKAAARLKEQAERQGIVVLAFYDAGTRHFFNSVRAIEKPSDLAGLRIRTMPNRYHKLWVETLGAVPVAMSTSSIQTAFREGQIDGAERSYLNYRDLRCLEVAPFFTRTRHFQLSACLAVSRRLWDTQDEDFRKRCRAAAAESENVERKAYQADDEAARAALVEKGLSILEPDINAWKICAEPVVAAFRKDPDNNDLVTAALAA